jgi:surfeit locus 1 family protein
LNTARPGFPIILTLLALAAMALLIGLGLWQVKRLHWKQHLLAEIAASQNAAPAPLGGVLAAAAAGRDVEYRKVQADCPDIETTPFVRLYAIKDAVAGYRIITACSLAGGPYGSILVDRGFVSDEDAPRLAASAGRTLPEPVVGILRRGDPKTFVSPDNQPAENLWYWRDVPAMAQRLGVARPAPLFLMLQQPAPRGFGPVPAAVPTDIPNNHLQYAATWFGLAAALAGVYLAMLWRRWSS